MIPLFVLLFTLMAVLASSTSGDLKLLRCADHPIRIGDERKRLVLASPVMTKSWGHQLGEATTRTTAS
jgi:hypothetical protein